MDARKEKMDEQAAWALLKEARQVFAAKGKSRKEFEVNEDNRDDILKAAMGPSGNLRAPTFKVGEDYLVGYNEEMYEALLSE
nr:ArsC family (seleno)protein [uncultured Desulfuromonas sp.]